MTRPQQQAHTPGPWRIGYSDGSGANPDGFGPYTIQTLDDEMIVDARSGERSEYGVLGYEDACLIAAAPDLLAALENLLTYDRVERPAFRAKPVGAPGSDARIQQDKLIALENAARAAIAKASGESGR